MVVGKTGDTHSPDEQITASKGERGSLDPEELGHRSFKDKLKNPFPELRDKLKDTHLYDVKVGAIQLKHRIGKLENLVNTNHRHDEAHEQATDNKRTLIAESHRFQSFAPERDGNRIKWYIDGRDYFHAVSVALERAKETIYIEDWWLSPELFLRRPPHENQEWRLDQVLKRAAERGVKIYIVVYREVAQALTCNSQHTKHALEALCPKGTPGYGNIVIMRHPDHNFFENAGDMTFYWAHHEKFIVIDYDLAFIGGLDLCFGRWDARQHALADAHPTGVQNEVWPGQDFNNNRIMDFQTVQDWNSNDLSKTDYGRMPWHDVAMGVIGPCVYDIAEHFVLRWNFVKRDKYKRDVQYDWLTMTGRTGENEDLIGVQRPKHPVGDYINHPLSPLENKTGRPGQARLVKSADQARPGAHRLDSDGNPETFHDAAEAPDAHGYTAEQHRRPDLWLKDHGYTSETFDGPHEWAREHGLHRPHLGTDKTLPALPGGAKNPSENVKPQNQENDHMTGQKPKKEGTVSASGGVNEKSKGYSSEIVRHDTEGGQGTVHAQLVRSSADWSSGILTEQSIQNAYCQVIRDAKHFVYIENQFFITATGDQQKPIHNLIGRAIVDAVIAAHKESRKFRVILVIPAIPGFAGDLRDDAAAGTRAIMDYQYKSINRGEHSIFGQIRAAGANPDDYVHVFNLRSYDRINHTPELKKQQEESGVSYQELQRANAQEIAGEGLHGPKGEDRKRDKSKRFVKDKVPKRGNGSSDSESDTEAKEQRKQENTKNAADTKARFEQHRKNIGDRATSKEYGSVDSIAKDALLGEPKPSEEAYAGRSNNSNDQEAQDLRDQEKENFVQEELYIHGKLLIVDDRIAICGSSNINDRSQLGFHDSELSIVMEDTRTLPSKMNGNDYLAGHHAATLRRMLWREHLGLLPAQDIDASDDINALPPSDGDNDWFAGDEWDSFVTDPLSDKLWEMWTERATTNTETFRALFHADPDNNVRDFKEYDRFLPKGQAKAGHLFDPYRPVDDIRAELDKIKGHLVWWPMRFLEDAEMAERGIQVNAWTESVYT